MTTDLKPEEPDHAEACGWTRRQARVRLADETTSWLQDDQGVGVAINALYICPSTEEVTMELTARVAAPWTEEGDYAELWDSSYQSDEADCHKRGTEIVASVCVPAKGGRAYTPEQAQAFYLGRAARRAGTTKEGSLETLMVNNKPADPEAVADGWNAADAEIAAMLAEHAGRLHGGAS